MSERRYTLSEIDRMRDALRNLIVQPGEPFYEKDVLAKIDSRMQSYITAGIRPEEIEEQLAEVRRARWNAGLVTLVFEPDPIKRNWVAGGNYNHTYPVNPTEWSAIGYRDGDQISGAEYDEGKRKIAEARALKEDVRE